LTCPTYIYNHPWGIPEDLPHNIISHPEFSSLYLKSITTSHPGNYSCNNDQGHHYFTLDVLGKNIIIIHSIIIEL